MTIRFVRIAICFCGLAVGIGPARSADAQAKATAERTLGVTLFVGDAAIGTGFHSTNNGVSFGGDVSTHLRWVDPAFEVRYSYSRGDALNETAFSTGLKLSRRYRRAHPYVDFEVGVGNVAFQHVAVVPGTVPYLHDDSTIYVSGGGVDYPLTRWFSVRADVQAEVWKLGHATGYLTPYVATVGLVYRVPYRYLRGRRF